VDALLYVLVRGVIAGLQALPLRWVARLGRLLGALAYALDGRHRRIALANLKATYAGEKSEGELAGIARENFRRLGENYGCAIKTSAMTDEQLKPHCRWVGLEKFPAPDAPAVDSYVIALGHFGNFEVFARWGQFFPQYECATTYRGFKQPFLNRLIHSLRVRSGCRFFERRTEAAELRRTLTRGGVMLGLLCDQHAGHTGLWLPFLGRHCSTSPAPALLALRYHCRLFTAVCYREGLAQWVLEAGNEIPTQADGEPRTTEAITLEINRELELAIHRDPANWFWVHNRWKPKSRSQTSSSGSTAAESTEPGE
jgi:lauroyl/myristoyl acyltransferase